MPICCHPFKRFLAFFYDAIVNIALWMGISLVLVICNNGEAIGRQYYPGYQILLITISFLFYTLFWHYYGQTIGMRAWRLKIVNESGLRIEFITAIKRFFIGLGTVSLLGLPLVFALFNKNRWSVMEYLSGSYIVPV